MNWLTRYLYRMTGSVLIGSSLSGCQMLRPSDRPAEYDAMRRDVEGHENSEGDWVRPEGVRAEKAKDSTMSKWLQNVPLIGTPPVDKEKANQLYLEADAIFERAKNAEGKERSKLFIQAAEKYKAAGKNWVSSAREQESIMMTAESYFFAEEYPEAEQYYAKLLKEYDRTIYQEKIDSRRMEIALYWLQVERANPKYFVEINLTDDKIPWNDTDGHGKRVLNKLRLDNPTGKLADDATMELANVAFTSKDYETAAEHYADLRMTYPDSPHQFPAHFLGLQSVLKTYQGAEYSVEPLEEAEKLVKQMVRQFPTESKAQQEYLNRAYAEIRYFKAERTWNKAERYIKRQEYSSARDYLNRILTEYGDTPFAEEAREAQSVVNAHPEDTPRYFQWLRTMFPERDKVNDLVRELGAAQVGQ